MDIIYKPWPADVVQESLQTFAETMRDGAGIKELQSGLIGLDFICRASELTEFQQDRLFGLETEAKMRISLMIDKEVADNNETQTDLAKKLLLHLYSLEKNLRRIMNSRTSEASDIYAYLDRIREYRKQRT